MLITWSPPVYFSKDIPFGSTVSYNVLVTDDDGDVIMDKSTDNPFIKVDNITECDTFNASVTAQVLQYSSINSTDRNNGSECCHNIMVNNYENDNSAISYIVLFW